MNAKEEEAEVELIVLEFDRRLREARSERRVEESLTERFKGTENLPWQ